MGIETWWLIASTPEWRHGLNIGTSCWYKEARLFRQPGLKDWPGVISAVASELKEFVANGLK
jgi:hypothetical protein